MTDEDIEMGRMRGRKFTFSESQTSQRRKDELYSSLFEECDLNNDGVVSTKELYAVCKRDKDVPCRVICQVMELAGANNRSELTYDEFVDLVKNPQLRHLVQGSLHSYVRTMIPRRRVLQDEPVTPSSPFFLRSMSVRTEETEYEDTIKYSCWPPPIGLLIMAIITIIPFACDEIIKPGSTQRGTGPTAVWFIYDPSKRYEAWRYVSYMFVHIGYNHIVINLIVLLSLGIPLEMVHKAWRVLVIYISGVVAGSLATSVVDPRIYLAGASGGVYAIMTSHIATLVMNWKETSYASFQMIYYLVIMVADWSSTLYERYANGSTRVGIVAHAAGALAGICIGMDVLINLRVAKWEIIFKWIGMTIFLVLMVTAITMNIFWYEHFPVQI